MLRHEQDIERFGSADTVSIIGGGWSVGKIDISRIPGTKIGVNDSAILVPGCTFGLSMDRLWTENRWPALQALCDRQEMASAYIRRSAMQNIPEPWPAWAVGFDNQHTTNVFSYPPGNRLASQAPRLNGENSGVCALNLAYHLRPSRVLLFGFDMCRSPDGKAYWYPPYPWAKPEGGTSDGKYKAWAAAFDTCAHLMNKAGIEVLNASPDSKITAFRKVPPAEVLE